MLFCSTPPLAPPIQNWFLLHCIAISIQIKDVQKNIPLHRVAVMGHLAPASSSVLFFGAEAPS